MNFLDQFRPQQIHHEVGYQDMGNSCWGQGPYQHDTYRSTSVGLALVQTDWVPGIKLLLMHPPITLAKLVVVAKVQNGRVQSQMRRKKQTPHKTLAQ